MAPPQADPPSPLAQGCAGRVHSVRAGIIGSLRHMVSVRHHLNRSLAMYRPVTSEDGQGGQEVSLELVAGELPAKVDQPTAEELEVAAQWGAKITHVVYVLPGAGVVRGDELRGDDGYGVTEVFRVVYAIRPSQPRYLKLGCLRTQSEPLNEVS